MGAVSIYSITVYELTPTNDEHNLALETVVDQEDLKTHFPKRGERPDIKLKYAKKPLGTVGRGKFQLENIIGISEKDLKFCKVRIWFLTILHVPIPAHMAYKRE